MTDSPLNAIGLPLTAQVGKHDFRPDPNMQAIDLVRRIKAYQAHVAGAPNQKRFVELCDELFAVLRHQTPPQP